MTVRIVIDEENHAERWWDAFLRFYPSDPALSEIRTKIVDEVPGGYVVAPSDIADGFIAWSTTLPGWSDGPEHAPHPLFLAPDEGAP